MTYTPKAYKITWLNVMFSNPIRSSWLGLCCLCTNVLYSLILLDFICICFSILIFCKGPKWIFNDPHLFSEFGKKVCLAIFIFYFSLDIFRKLMLNSWWYLLWCNSETTLHSKANFKISWNHISLSTILSSEILITPNPHNYLQCKESWWNEINFGFFLI